MYSFRGLAALLAKLHFAQVVGILLLWRTDEVVMTVDDFFPERNDDHAFDHNYVRLLESTPAAQGERGVRFPRATELSASAKRRTGNERLSDV